MRTIPEIVAQMKDLIAELEQHTGLPVKPDVIKFNFDNMNSGTPISYYENDTITLSFPTETTTTKF